MPKPRSTDSDGCQSWFDHPGQGGNQCELEEGHAGQHWHELVYSELIWS